MTTLFRHLPRCAGSQSRLYSVQSAESLLTSLQRLAIQPKHYAKVHIHAQSYIVTKGDLIHLPVKLKGCSIGDSLSLTRISSFGSRDYTLSNPSSPSETQMFNPDATPKSKVSHKRELEFIDPGLCTVKATVLEHTKQPMKFTIKKKRRNRHAKLVKSKQNYTVLRVSEVTPILDR